MSSEQILWKLIEVDVEGINEPRLSEINLHIPAGITAVSGWSGAGKSTLIQLLSGQLDITSGVIEQCYKAQSSCPLFIVPQDFGLWPRINVLGHIIKAMPVKDREKALSLLKTFDLEDKSDCSIDTLSQGECSRLSVARALATEADILLMDEPLANVDSARKDIYWQAIIDYATEKKRSVIFSTHIPSEAIAYSENIICLHKGQVISYGKTLDVYHNPEDVNTASLLGPGNWIENEDWAHGKSFCRPEELTITENDQGSETVISSRFYGLYTNSELTGKNGVRKFIHSSKRPLPKGVKVIISLMLLFIFFSCTPGDESTLEFSSVSSWNVPSSGQRLPGPRAVSPGLNNEVIVLDDAGRLLVYDESGKEIKRWPMPATDLGHPEGAAVFSDGRIAVADTHYARVVVFKSNGEVDFTFGKSGVGLGDFYSPVGITLDKDENIYVCEYGKNDRVQKFTKEGKFILSFGESGTGNGQLQRASDLIWHEGKIYVADAVNNRIQVFTDDGKFVKVLAHDKSNLYMPYDIDMSPDGFLYIAEYGHSRITKMDFNGKVIGRFGSPGTELNQFKTPWGIAVSAKGIVYVADTGNRRITRLEK